MIRIVAQLAIEPDPTEEGTDQPELIRDRILGLLERSGSVTVIQLDVTAGPDPDSEEYGAWAQGEATEAFRSAAGSR